MQLPYSSIVHIKIFVNFVITHIIDSRGGEGMHTLNIL